MQKPRPVADPCPLRPRTAWTLLALIVFAGLALRLYRLDEQSVWYDEYISIVHVDKPDVGSYLDAQKAANWNLVPVYYALQYWWANHVTGSVIGVRILSILFGILAIPMLYLLGVELYDRRAGLAAALCLSLSYIHIYQAQEIRNYSLTMLAGLLSGFTFVKVLHERGRFWWPLHWAANLLLVWTHLFGAFLLLAEGLMLIATRARRWRMPFFWGTTNIILMSPSLLWIRGIENRVAPLPRSPLWAFVGNAFADCRTVAVGMYIPEQVQWQVAPGVWTHFFEATYRSANDLLLLLSFAAVVYMAVVSTVSYTHLTLPTKRIV